MVQSRPQSSRTRLCIAESIYFVAVVNRVGSVAASLIKAATSFGRDSMGTWLVGRVRVFAFIFSALSFSCWGIIMRWFEAMTTQVGLLRQAGIEIVPPSAAP